MMEKVSSVVTNKTITPASQATAGNIIQRDLAVQPPNPASAPPQLTAKQIKDAIDFNNERYNKENIELIQDIVGGPRSGIMVKETIELIALYQFENNMAKIDGMVGADTFNLLTTELTAENASKDTCLTMFNVQTGGPMTMHAAGPNLANIFGHFEVEILFSPHCDCSRFEYRQFICGNVTHNGNNINANFAIPGGGLPAIGAWVEDGNTTLANNGRFGHRNHLPNQGITNQYIDANGQPDMANGCRFNSIDQPGVTAGPAAHNDVYVFDFRFFGDVMKDGKKIERKFWAVQETITIP
jgi:hypothetical protein